MLPLGTLINAAGILIGGLLGLARCQMNARTQLALKSILGVLIVFVGLSTSWSGMAGGGFGKFFKFLLIAILAMVLGRLTGRLLRLQKGLNKLGQFAGRKVAAASAGKHVSWSDGFIACTILFCLPPMAIFGAALDGLDGRWQTLALKAVMDGMAMMVFARTFKSAAFVSALPVAALLGSITLGVRLAVPHLPNPGIADALHATTGLLVFCVALIVLEFRKVELADYLPSLAWAPLLGWLWK